MEDLLSFEEQFVGRDFSSALSSAQHHLSGLPQAPQAALPSHAGAWPTEEELAEEGLGRERAVCIAIQCLHELGRSEEAFAFAADIYRGSHLAPLEGLPPNIPPTGHIAVLKLLFKLKLSIGNGGAGQAAKDIIEPYVMRAKSLSTSMAPTINRMQRQLGVSTQTCVDKAIVRTYLWHFMRGDSKAAAAADLLEALANVVDAPAIARSIAGANDESDSRAAAAAAAADAGSVAPAAGSASDARLEGRAGGGYSGGQASETGGFARHGGRGQGQAGVDVDQANLYGDEKKVGEYRRAVDAQGGNSTGGKTSDGGAGTATGSAQRGGGAAGGGGNSIGRDDRVEGTGVVSLLDRYLAATRRAGSGMDDLVRRRPDVAVPAIVAALFGFLIAAWRLLPIGTRARFAWQVVSIWRGGGGGKMVAPLAAACAFCFAFILTV